MTATIPEIPRPVASNHRSLPVDFVGEFVGEGTVEGLVLNVEWKFLEWNYFFFFEDVGSFFLGWNYVVLLVGLWLGPVISLVEKC